MFKINPKYYSVDATTLYGVLLCIFLLSGSAYFQIVMGMQPCPLCIVQRMMLVAIGFFLLLQLAIEDVLIDRINGVLAFFSALIGAAAAGRQVWLEHLPADQVPACGASLDYMLKTLPLTETLRLLLEGSGDCAVVSWRFLSFSMAEWTLFFFVVYIILILVNLYRI